MSLSKYSKRRGQFEALEAKQLFAADLVGGAAADLPDTVVVAENARTIMGGIKTSEESVVAAGTNQSGLVNNIGIPTDGIGWVSVENLGIRGTELCIGGSNATMTAVAGSSEDGSVPTESVSFNFDDIPHEHGGRVFESLGGQEGEDIIINNNSFSTTAGNQGAWTRNLQAVDCPQLGGQEGEPVVDPNDCPELGGQEGEPVVDPNDCPMSLVDHVFQDYARDDFQITDQHYFAVR
jgi:hypothetical protein